MCPELKFSKNAVFLNFIYFSRINWKHPAKFRTIQQVFFFFARAGLHRNTLSFIIHFSFLFFKHF